MKTQEGLELEPNLKKPMSTNLRTNAPEGDTVDVDSGDRREIRLRMVFAF